VAIALLASVAAMGGGARADILSLVLLRPLTVALAAWALVGLTRRDIAGFGSWLAMAAFVIAVPLLQLVPLPPAMWEALPGRELLTAIYAETGQGHPWRPFALDPQMTRNALWSLAAPLAALILAIRGGSAGQRTMLRAVLIAGLVSGLLGVVQYASGTSSPLYLYRISNFGSAVGLFANRNHAGVFLACMFPLLAAFAVTGHDERKRRARLIGAVAMAAALIPMIFTTGSRAGLITGVIGLVGAGLVARPRLGQIVSFERVPRSRRLLVAVGAAAFLVFCAVFIGLNPGNSLDRLLGGPDSATELRWPIWRATVGIIVHVFPWGTGFGGFPQVFKVYEPDSLLGPVYINHAHNDFLEVTLDGGILGVALLVAGLALIARDVWRVWRAAPSRSDVILARAASVALCQLALASAFDYPLRTPLMAVAGMTLLVWLRRGTMPDAAVSGGSPTSRHSH
jgi:O-antigen ligase